MVRDGNTDGPSIFLGKVWRLRQNAEEFILMFTEGKTWSRSKVMSMAGDAVPRAPWDLSLLDCSSRRGGRKIRLLLFVAVPTLARLYVAPAQMVSGFRFRRVV
jgi:hypothetical protein